MAETLFLVNKGSQVGATFVNEINACLINSDDDDCYIFGGIRAPEKVEG